MNEPYKYGFQPGDRVMYDDTVSGAFQDLTGVAGTIKLIGRKEIINIKWDIETIRGDHNIEYIKPAPIKVGDWVRVTGRFPDEMNNNCIGQKFQVQEIEGETACYSDRIPHCWPLKHLQAIEAPAPSINIADIEPREYFVLTANLRINSETGIEQLWQGSNGTQEWRPLPTHTPEPPRPVKGDRVKYIGVHDDTLNVFTVGTPEGVVIGPGDDPETLEVLFIGFSAVSLRYIFKHCHHANLRVIK